MATSAAVKNWAVDASSFVSAARLVLSVADVCGPDTVVVGPAWLRHVSPRTVIAALAVSPPLAAVIVVDPGDIPVTSPLLFTCATVASLVVQATGAREDRKSTRLNS